MKWNKFVKVLEANPWFQWHVGPPALVSLPLNVPADAAQRKLKDYIRTQVNYVAFRTWDNLDLNSRNTENLIKRPHPKYRNLTVAHGTSVEYVLRFHIEGNEEAFHRIRHIETSIADSIQHLVTWHAECWALQNKNLRLDAVVKITSHWNEESKFNRQEFEVYEFPQDFVLPKIAA